jgi:membrane protease YdiL (CAAX protease family)
MKEKRAPMKGWARVLIILVPFIITFVIFQVLGFKVLGLSIAHRPETMEPFQEMIVSLFGLCGTILVVGLFRRLIDKESFQSMGFYRFRGLKDTFIGFAIGAVIMVVGFLLLVILKEITWVDSKFDLNKIFQLFILFVIVAVNEELLFRGYILNNLMKSMDKRVALVVTSVGFSLMHIANPDFGLFSFFNIILAGILLGISYIYTKSLWLPIALHFSWNFFQGPVFGYNVSGQVIGFSMISQTRGADDLLNGGAFGFEGSILSIVFQVVAIIVIYKIFNKKEADYSLSTIPVESV